MNEYFDLDDMLIFNGMHKTCSDKISSSYKLSNYYPDFNLNLLLLSFPN